MAGKVSVNVKAIENGIKCCDYSIELLEDAAAELKRKYIRAGEDGWSDEKYRDLGEVIGNCCDAMLKPVEELQENIRKLESLRKAVETYESVNI